MTRFTAILLVLLGLAALGITLVYDKYAEKVVLLESANQHIQELNRSIDRYIQAEKAAREAQAKVRERYERDKKDLKEALEHSSEWSTTPLPDDVIRVLKNSTNSTGNFSPAAPAPRSN